MRNIDSPRSHDFEAVWAGAKREKSRMWIH